MGVIERYYTFGWCGLLFFCFIGIIRARKLFKIIYLQKSSIFFDSIKIITIFAFRKLFFEIVYRSAAKR